MDASRAFYYASNKVDRKTDDFEMEIYHNQDKSDRKLSMSKVVKAQTHFMNQSASRIKDAYPLNIQI